MPVSSHGAFSHSRWFRRGWTLQELLGPSRLMFYASDWTRTALREDISGEISAITNIGKEFLCRPPTTDVSRLLAHASVAERMSWASQQQTTRDEDIAYSLLGIFGINMPLLYGEGHRAFLRLQEEIIKWSDDQSIFAWADQPQPRGRATTGVFPLRPRFTSHTDAILFLAVAGTATRHTPSQTEDFKSRYLC